VLSDLPMYSDSHCNTLNSAQYRLLNYFVMVHMQGLCRDCKKIHAISWHFDSCRNLIKYFVSNVTYQYFSLTLFMLLTSIICQQKDYTHNKRNNYQLDNLKSCVPSKSCVRHKRENSDNATVLGFLCIFGAWAVSWSSWWPYHKTMHFYLMI